MAPSVRLAHRLTVRRADGERGASTVETVIVYPVILLLIFTIVQSGLWIHAREVALHTANAASTAASAENAGDSAAVAAANDFVERAGSLQQPTVVVNRSADLVTVTVTGRSPSLVPGVQMPPITQTSTAAIERFVP